MIRRTVNYQSENMLGPCPAILQGDVSKTKKGVIVMQEWWGMNEQILSEAAEIGTRGNFVTIVPDLYRGRIAKDFEEASHSMATLDWEGAVKDIQGAAKFLLRHGCTKVGVLGFCMGGALSIAASVLVQEISAAAPFYGIPPARVCNVTKVRVPLQCHFATEDKSIGFASKKDYDVFRKQLDDGGVVHEFLEYQGSNHAFTNRTQVENFNEAACALAFERVCAFMNLHLV